VLSAHIPFQSETIRYKDGQSGKTGNEDLGISHLFLKHPGHWPTSIEAQKVILFLVKL
jgi:hypothetical protein